MCPRKLTGCRRTGSFTGPGLQVHLRTVWNHSAPRLQPSHVLVKWDGCPGASAGAEAGSGAVPGLSAGRPRWAPKAGPAGWGGVLRAAPPARWGLTPGPVAAKARRPAPRSEAGSSGRTHRTEVRSLSPAGVSAGASPPPPLHRRPALRGGAGRGGSDLPGPGTDSEMRRRFASAEGGGEPRRPARVSTPETPKPVRPRTAGAQGHGTRHAPSCPRSHRSLWPIPARPAQELSCVQLMEGLTGKESGLEGRV